MKAEEPEAACREYGPDLFFPDSRGRDSGERDFRKLRPICVACPLRTPCRRMVLESEGTKAATSRWGMFGGWSPRQRAAIARRVYGVVDPDEVEQGDLFDIEVAS